ncbi:MAG: hypothetical protein HOP07_18135 [Bacteriovoracaceae bacterium]|nr:hypothetical protein [Bacteriovoracaceae bacterium]
MDHNEISLDLLLKETLAMSEFLRSSKTTSSDLPIQTTFLSDDDNFDDDYDDDYLLDPEVNTEEFTQVFTDVVSYPNGPGVIYKIDNSHSTFCVRGISVANISEGFSELLNIDSSKRPVLKIVNQADFESISFFETKTFELAEVLREQIINRRFPHQEDAVCNISDPGFSWWMNVSDFENKEDRLGRFEIFFRSHGINRAEKYIQLGPIGDGSVAALRLNQARTLLRSSFPIGEFSCDDKSFSVASLKPDHLGFISFKNIFLEGVNNTKLENFPDNSLGRTLFYYFHELSIVRKFWIEVKAKLS